MIIRVLFPLIYLLVPAISVPSRQNVNIRQHMATFTGGSRLKLKNCSALKIPQKGSDQDATATRETNRVIQNAVHAADYTAQDQKRKQEQPGYTSALLGSFTAPRNSTFPDESSTTRKRKGRLKMISDEGIGAAAENHIGIAVTAAASVPFSST
jgi:hypothetical protein